MSASPETRAPTPGGGDVDEHGGHPTPRDYVRIALILAVLTAMEYSTYVFDFGSLGVPLLIALIAVKFVYVAGWFMHLKFDTRLFSRLMYGGLAGAFTLYLVAVVVMLFASATPIE